MSVCMYVCLHAFSFICMHVLVCMDVYARVDEWIDGWVGGRWMDVWMYLRSFHCMNLCVYMYRVYNVLCNIFIQREMWARSRS